MKADKAAAEINPTFNNLIFKKRDSHQESPAFFVQ